jgi:hypothetical protein
MHLVFSSTRATFPVHFNLLYLVTLAISNPEGLQSLAIETKKKVYVK